MLFNFKNKNKNPDEFAQISPPPNEPDYPIVNH